MFFLLSAFFFFKITFFEKFFQEHYQSVKQFVIHSVDPDMGTECCKGYLLGTKVAASKERVNMEITYFVVC